MHSDSAEIKKSIRTYMMVGLALLVFTGITVGANQFHFGVPVAVTVALIIAMLVIVAGVLGGFASFFIYLMRRAKLAAAEEASEGIAQ